MLKLISLYTGIGGLDFGFEAAGYETCVAVEMDKFSCATLRANRPDWPVIEADINAVASDEILSVAKLKVGEADALIGGPPCQPFSKSSYWARGDSLRLDDPRADTLTAYLRVLRDTQPKTFLLENVGGLAFKSKDEGLRLLLDGIAEINRQCGTNYQPTWKLLKCAEFGVPQLRERVFLVGSRDGKSFEFPQPTHCDPDSQTTLELNENSLKPYVTAWDAIGDLPRPNDLDGLTVGGKWGDLLPSIPEGENYLWHTPRGGGKPLFGWRTRYWSFLLKLAKNRPSWTIQAQPGSAIGPFHWDNRKLTFEEMCRIQTFPDGLSMPFGRTEMQRMLGNAVPSLMAEHLGREMANQLLGKEISRIPVLATRCQVPIPDPSGVKAVPEKYLHMVGNHAPHPGTGKGKGALGEATAFPVKARKQSKRTSQEAFDFST